MSIFRAAGSQKKIAEEYRYLSRLSNLSVFQENRLDTILKLAVVDSLLDQCIQNVEISSLSVDDKEEILVQQAKMRVCLDLGTC